MPMVEMPAQRTRQHGIREHRNRLGTRRDVVDLWDGSVSLLRKPWPPIRVLIGDDSAVMRSELTRMLNSSPQMRVCGSARTGEEVVAKAKLLHPDVITLDVEMPLLNGVEALKRIMSECPCPVIMFSSATRRGAEVTLEALSAGAFDYLRRVSPQPGANAVKLQQDLIEKIEAASHGWIARKRALLHPLPAPGFPITVQHLSLRRMPRLTPQIIVVGTSTGGPQALLELLPELPGDLPVPMIVVQHMPPGFTAPLAKRLDGLCRVKVCEAQHGQAVVPGTVYIAPAGQHTTLVRNSKARNSPANRSQSNHQYEVSICLSDTPSNTVHKPSVDVTMQSVASVFGDLTLGIILTGMGTDGLQGMTAIRDAGGVTMGQDEASSVVYGMPRCCAEHGILQQVMPLSNVAGHILQAVHYRHKI
jgi:two-component system, chemotaxis family, protein-glutamate methylesterase/glutaminase